MENSKIKEKDANVDRKGVREQRTQMRKEKDLMFTEKQ